MGELLQRLKPRWLEKRLEPADSPAAVAASVVLAVAAALAVTVVLFLAYGANPLAAFYELFHEPFGTLRGFGYTLAGAAPLSLIALGAIVCWRAGFEYLGFEGCFVLGAAASAWLALAAAPGGWLASLPFPLFLALAIFASAAAGGIWAAATALLRVRSGGNEVLISLMANYVAIFFVQYLVSWPMRAPGSLPETAQMPRSTWLPFLWHGGRAHAGILLAIAAALAVWALLKKTRLGFEMLVMGANLRAARYAGIPAGRRMVAAALIGGGLGGVAGMTELLGAQHRLMDGISGGVGFLGLIVALLARLNPLAVLPTAILYAGMSVGADAIERRTTVPTSITLILESLIVLFVLAAELLRRYRVRLPFSREATEAKEAKR